MIPIIGKVRGGKIMKNLIKPLLAVKTKRGYSILSAVMVTLFSAWVIFDETKVSVVLATDGEKQIVKAHMQTVEDLLEEVDIEVGEHDYLSHDLDTKLVEGMEVEFKTAEKVILTVDGQSETMYTTASTVGELFNEEMIELNKFDRISHDVTEKINENMEIIVDRAFEINVIDGGEKHTYWTTKVSVKQFLQENDIEFNRLDKIEPELDALIDEETTITIIRVVKLEKEVEEFIDYEIEEKKDASMEKGKTKVLQKGKKGLAKRTYEITKENGKEVDRKLVKEKIIEEPVKQVIAVGTKEVATVGSTTEPQGKGKVMVMEATGYGADCRGCSGITATGINIKNNPNAKVISVDPNVIPLGSRVWVEGYGVAIAGDTGGAIKGNRIDVLLPSEDYARKHWGRRTVKVKILD